MRPLPDGTLVRQKSAADRDAVESYRKPAFFPRFDRVLALEIGARETTRRLGLKEGTVLSYAYRYGWDLPKRHNVGRPQSA